MRLKVGGEATCRAADFRRDALSCIAATRSASSPPPRCSMAAAETHRKIGMWASRERIFFNYSRKLLFEMNERRCGLCPHPNAHPLHRQSMRLKKSKGRAIPAVG
jgi:hypothetical protein